MSTSQQPLEVPKATGRKRKVAAPSPEETGTATKVTATKVKKSRTRKKDLQADVASVATTEPTATPDTSATATEATTATTKSARKAKKTRTTKPKKADLAAEAASKESTVVTEPTCKQVSKQEVSATQADSLSAPQAPTELAPTESTNSSEPTTAKDAAARTDANVVSDAHTGANNAPKSLDPSNPQACFTQASESAPATPETTQANTPKTNPLREGNSPRADYLRRRKQASDAKLAGIKAVTTEVQATTDEVLAQHEGLLVSDQGTFKYFRDGEVVTVNTNDQIKAFKTKHDNLPLSQLYPPTDSMEEMLASFRKDFPYLDAQCYVIDRYREEKQREFKGCLERTAASLKIERQKVRSMVDRFNQEGWEAFISDVELRSRLQDYRSYETKYDLVRHNLVNELKLKFLQLVKKL